MINYTNDKVINYQ